MTTDLHTSSFKAVLHLLLQRRAVEDSLQPGTYVVPTNSDIAEAINRKHGPGTITGEYIRRLRRGDIKNPSVQTASLLADYFGVSLDAFNTTPTRRRLSPAAQLRVAAYAQRLEEIEDMERAIGAPAYAEQHGALSP